MKKYQIILIILLVSLLYVPRGTLAKVSDYYSEITYSDELYEKKQMYQEDMDLIKQWLITNGLSNNGTTPINLSDNKYIIMYDLDTFNTNEKVIRIIRADYSNGSFKNYYAGSYNMYKVFRFNYSYSGGTFSINNGVVSKINGNYGTANFELNYVDQQCNPTLNNCTLKTGRYYFDTTFLADTYQYSFVEDYSSSNTNYDIPLKVGRIIHLFTPINLKEFFNYMGERTTPFTCKQNESFGSLQNFNTLVLKVNGSSHILDRDLQGKFVINYSGNIISDENFNVSVEKSDFLIGDYEFYCYADKTQCELRYTYNYQDDIESEIDLQFTITPKLNYSFPNRIELKGCMTTGNFTNIDYDYFNDENLNSDITNMLDDSSIGGTGTFIDEFFNSENFSDKHGITSIIQTPVSFLESLNNKTCTPIVIPLPFLNVDAEIPCMSTIYRSKLNNVYVIVSLAVNSVIVYKLCLAVVSYVKQAKDPEDDKIEVMDL